MRKFCLTISIITISFFIGYFLKSYIDKDLFNVVCVNPVQPLDIQTYDGGGGVAP